jgi:hypothetical protein
VAAIRGRPGSGSNSTPATYARHNVVAVYREMETAEAAVRLLRENGVSNDQISLRSRSPTDDPAARRVEPASEEPTRRRDAAVAGNVFKKITLMSLAGAVIGGGLGFGIALLLDSSDLITWIAGVVGVVAGSVIGGVWGGIFGSMGEAQREKGVAVGVHSDAPEEVERAAGILKRHGPMRIDRYDAEGRRIG